MTLKKNRHNFGAKTLGITTLIMTIKNATLCLTALRTKWRYAGCCKRDYYAECRCAECRDAKMASRFFTSEMNKIFGFFSLYIENCFYKLLPVSSLTRSNVVLFIVKSWYSIGLWHSRVQQLQIVNCIFKNKLCVHYRNFKLLFQICKIFKCLLLLFKMC